MTTMTRRKTILALGAGVLTKPALGQFAFIPGPAPRAPTAGGSSTTGRQFTMNTDALTNSINYLESATTFTVAFWFKSGSTGQSNTYISIMTHGGGSQVSITYGYASSGGNAQIEFFSPAAVGDFRTGSQITIVDTNWHHVAYRYNGTEWAYFLDGVKTVINASLSGSLPGGSPGTLSLGASGSTASMTLARYLMSSAALTDMQIATLAGGTCASTGVSGTVGYWLLGQGSPDPESSPSPNTNSLTVSGTSIVAGPTCSSS